MPCRSPASRSKDGWTSREIMLLIALIGTHCTDTRAQYLMPCWSPALQSKDGWMLKLLAWQEMTARTHCRKEKMQRAFSLCGSSTQALIAIMTRHRMRLINQVLQVDPCRYTWNILALFLFFQLDFVCQNLKFLLRQAERLGKFCFHDSGSYLYYSSSCTSRLVCPGLHVSECLQPEAKQSQQSQI